eukprot:TRINITY_DN8024_c1_g1_i1.p1 TRINITY_DN8024_c1_g1~~TRINITY_DN8024_c1_g1_i1.p1  ORF type:complete len:129 (+),score=12.35 TRINITY_DN8024_c1_g1_i1:229-615(+)
MWNMAGCYKPKMTKVAPLKASMRLESDPGFNKPNESLLKMENQGSTPQPSPQRGQAAASSPRSRGASVACESSRTLQQCDASSRHTLHLREEMEIASPRRHRRRAGAAGHGRRRVGAAARQRVARGPR